MTKKNYYDRPYGCSVEATLSVIGGRWKPVIIFNLLQNDVLRFGELKRKLEGITQLKITSKLRKLEKDKIVAIVLGVGLDRNLIKPRPYQSRLFIILAQIA